MIAYSVEQSTKNMLSQKTFSRFLVVGGAATALHYALTAIFISMELLSPTPASGAGFAISAAFNYIASAIYTFKGKHRHLVAFPRFAAAAGTGCLINVAGLHFLTIFGLPFIPSQLVATGLVILWNYLLSALWTFRQPIA
ncbi:MAG: GtrA family protein [Rubrivivax sp.]